MASATSVKLDDDMKERLRHLAEVRKRTSHWIMREAISQYVEREERRETLRLDTLKAWEVFQETGLHVTADEVIIGWRAGELTMSCQPLVPQMTFAPAAIQDLQWLRSFLRPKSVAAARGAVEAIRQGVKILDARPRLGRMVDDLPEEFREWLIEFGDSGYIVRYRLDNDGVVILKVRHQNEVGYY